MAARFDAERAQRLGQNTGDGTPIMLTIPTTRPWVPLRILGLGLDKSRIVDADVFLLTDRRPSLLAGGRGLSLDRDEPASASLLSDLRIDKGMSWVPAEMWFTYLRLQVPAGQLDYDLAVSVKPNTVPLLSRCRCDGASARALGEPGSEQARALAARRRGGRRDRGVRSERVVRAAASRRRGSAGVSRWVRAAVACGLAVATAFVGYAVDRPAHADASAVLGPGLVTVNVYVHYSHFSLASLEVHDGTTVRFLIHNEDPIEHEFIVGDASVQALHQHGTRARPPAGAGRGLGAPGPARRDLLPVRRPGPGLVRVPSSRALRLRHARMGDGHVVDPGRSPGVTA